MQTVGNLALSHEEEPSAFKAEANVLLEAAKGITVKTADDYQSAGRFFAHVKSKIKEVEAERTKRVKPLNDTVKLINADYKAISDKLEAICRAVEVPMLAFKREEERLRREAEEAARKERERLEAEAKEAARIEMEKAQKAREAVTQAEDPFEAALAEEEANAALENAKEAIRDIRRVDVPVDYVPNTVAAGTSFRKNWTFEVIDASLIPREYLIPDEKRIGELARSFKEKADIPGVRFYARESIGGR
jgi:hypothetical protein